MTKQIDISLRHESPEEIQELAPLLGRGVTVYCASARDIAPDYSAAARALGKALAAAGVPAVNGGGKMGLMGALNDAVLAAGGEAIGVIPRFMVDRGWFHPDVSTLIITDGMHQRKTTMAALSRGVIALPGGIGTLEELCEILTWRQLGLYGGPVVLLNVRGYYDAFVALIDKAVEEGFMKADHRALFHLCDNVDEAFRIALSGREEIHFSPKF